MKKVDLEDTYFESDDDEADAVLSQGEKQKVFDYLDSNYFHSELAWDGNKILYGLRNNIEPIDAYFLFE